MSTNLPLFYRPGYRRISIPVLVLLLLAFLSFLTGRQSARFQGSLASVKAANLVENDVSLAAKNSLTTYHWNLSDDGMPLISLPDHIGGEVDLSLTYAMDQFQFPLFQSLYYNEKAKKYILLVMSDQGGAKFIDLSSAGQPGLYQSRDNSNLRLVDDGDVKLITTADGSVYTFTKFADGELHCSNIKDQAGRLIDLKYTEGASLSRITDTSGRSIKFSYTNHYLSSITQAWGTVAKKKKQTWAIATEANERADAVKFAHAAASLKRVPTNAVKASYTDAMAASDYELAKMFGGPGATAAANGFEPVELGSQYPLYRGDVVGEDGVIRRGHLSFAMHLYGSADGTGEMGVFVPAGFTSHSGEPTPTDAVVTFYYPRLGNLSDVTLAVFHVANFHLAPEGERVRIGDIGGRGGAAATYRHSHLEFYRGDTGLPLLANRAKLRIDPDLVFHCQPAPVSP